MNNQVSINDLLKIEDCDEILQFRCKQTNIPIWLEIRSLFYRMIKLDMIYTTKNKNIYRSKNNRKIKLCNLSRSIIYNLLIDSRKESEILITTSSIGYSELNTSKNRLSDYFANVHENSLVLISNKDWIWRKPHNNSDHIFHDPLLLFPSICGKILSVIKDNQDDIEFIQFLKRRSNDVLGWEMSDKQFEFLVKKVSQVTNSLPLKYYVYKKFLLKRKIKVLIGLTLCYGFSALIVAAKELDIMVAEYQHGTISSGHIAYNFSQTLCNSECVKRALPSHFLGYGKWWIDSINAPIEKHIIGNPHRTEQLNELKKDHKYQNKVLILGDGIETERYLLLAINLKINLSSKYEIIFRPHPKERTSLNKFKHIHQNNYLTIDEEHDIYRSLLSTEIVISELSTGLFEAIGLVNRIFIWRTAKSKFALPDIPIASFSNLDELVEKIDMGEEGYINSNRQIEFWAPDWKNNYVRFLNETASIRLH